jgi:hypothetical protein
MNLGVLQPGQTASATGNIVPAGSQAFVSVTFTDNAMPGYHPQIALQQRRRLRAHSALGRRRRYHRARLPPTGAARELQSVHADRLGVIGGAAATAFAFAMRRRLSRA